LLANREMARDERLWEKRSALYEQMLEPANVVDAEQLDVIFSILERLRTPVWAYASDAVLYQYWVALNALQDVEQARGVDDEVHHVLVALEENHKLARQIRSALQEAPQRRRGFRFVPRKRAIRLGTRRLPNRESFLAGCGGLVK
jgi:hypothetical protein